MTDKIDPAFAGFDDTVLERWGLKPVAKSILDRAQTTGAITPQEISEMVSVALAKDRQKMAEVLRELKQTLASLNISVTFNVVHTHITQAPATVAAPAPKPEPKSKARELSVPPVAITTETRPAPQQPGDGHQESPFLNAKILQEHGLKPEALGILLAAKDKGGISPQQIGSLIPAEISQDSEKLRPTMRWITQLLSGLGIKIVIGEVHYKHPESSSQITSYSRPHEEKAPNKSKVNNVFFNPTRLTEDDHEEPTQESLLGIESGDDTDVEEEEFADPNGEFIPKFIFDKETAVSNPYYRAVKDHRFLKHEHLLELSRRWHMRGDYEARNTIVIHNLRLSMKIAAHYMGKGLDYDDLVQEGNIGLMVAAERFDPEKGFRFTTYATWWVRQHIQRAICNFRNIIRLPVHVIEVYGKILKATSQLGIELQREPTLEEVAARTGIDINKVKNILRQLKIPVMSLEELVFSGSSKDSNVTIGDRIVDNNFPSAVTALEAKEDLTRASLAIRTLLAVIKTLPIAEKSKTAFKMYYGLDGHPEGATLESIATSPGFNVSSERIRQINVSVWNTLAEYGVSMDDKKLVEAIRRVRDLEDIVGDLADLSPLTEASVLNQISSVFNNTGGDDGELIPADFATMVSHLQANSETVAPGNLTTEDIVRVVREIYRVTQEMILGDSNELHVVLARRVCMFILREKLGLTFLEIGKLLHCSGQSAMFGHRRIANTMELDPKLKLDVEKAIGLCGPGQEKPVGPEQVTQTAEELTGNEPTSPIVDHVLTLTSQVFGVEKTRLFARSRTRPDEGEQHRIRAKCLAMYALRSDFSFQSQEVAQIFGFSNYSRVSVLNSQTEEELKVDNDLQAKLAQIRGQYSLDIYEGNLAQLKQRQKTLFPKQAEEIKSVVEKIVTPFMQMVKRLHTKLETLDVPDRDKEIFRHRFKGDLREKIPTYESLGHTYEISRERVHQILVATMRHLTQTLEPSDADLMVNYTQEFEKARFVVELQNL